MDTIIESNSICRSCMTSKPAQTFDLFESSQLVELYIRLSLTNLDNEDPLPKSICNNCYHRLKDFESFQAMCIESYRTLLCQFPVKVDLKEENIEALVKNEKIDEYNLEPEESQEYPDSTDDAGIDYDPLNDVGESDLEEKVVESLKIEIVAEENRSSDDEFLDKFVEKVKKRRSKRKKKDSSTEDCEIKTEEKGETESRKKTVSKKDPKCTKKPFNCDKCTKTFFKEFRYEAHMRTHQGLKAYACNLCNKGYSKPQRLKYHIRNMHTENIELIPCSFDGCEKSYKNRETLTQHFRLVHTNLPKIDKTDRPGIICELCGKVLSSNAVLRKHNLIHTNEFPFACDICPKKYRTQCKLDVHMKKHQGIKNFQCQICGLKKTTGHELNVHMNVHTRKKTYPCQFCEASFLSNGNLVRHVRVVHKGIKTYVCTFCDQRFGKAETLKHHVMRHTGEKPHECPICRKRFIQKTSFQYHVKRHGKRENVSDSAAEETESGRADMGNELNEFPTSIV